MQQGEIEDIIRTLYPWIYNIKISFKLKWGLIFIFTFAILNFYLMLYYSRAGYTCINGESALQYSLDIQIKNSEIKEITDDQITILIKTMDRPRCLEILVNNIRKYHEKVQILIADDGHIKSPIINASRVHHFIMPLDSGLSAGRNLLLSQVTTPYIVVADDDFSWKQNIIPDFIKSMASNPTADLIGGKAGLDFAGLLVDKGEELFLVQDNIGHSNNSGMYCQWVDFVPNFFIAKTTSVLKVLWDNRLFLGEHENFFLRFKLAKLKVLYCPDIVVDNLQVKCGSDSPDIEDLRLKKRARGLAFIKMGIASYGYDSIAYCLGADFKNTLWEITKGPSGQDCYKLPLPNHCHSGFEGLNCDRCRKGFRGNKCDKCQTNYYGPECIHCSCHSGKCIIDPQIKCLCNTNYYGIHCDRNMVLKKTELIIDPGFHEIEKTKMNHWFPWRDGCMTYTTDGLLFNSYNGLKCGVGQFIAINQRFPSEFVLFLSAKVIKIEKESLISTDEFCLYVDVTFTDGSNHWGLMAGFGQIVTKDYQVEHIVLDFEKSIKSLRIYFILRQIKAIVLISNFELKIGG